MAVSATVVSDYTFVEISSALGIRVRNVSGGVAKKDVILETTGNGVLIFDYDRDGANDIFIPSGSTLDGKSTATPQLYRNDGHGHFSDVAAAAGLGQSGWAQGACSGDYDGDGYPDLLVTYYGYNRLYRNLGNGKFEDVTASSGLPVSGTRWGTGCAFFDYDRDGRLDIFVSNYVDLDLAHVPRPGSSDSCKWKDIPVMCGPRGLPLAHNVLYHNDGGGHFSDVTAKAGISKAGGRYSLGVVTADFDNDGWPDIYVACDMTPSLLFHNKHDGTFEERAVAAGVAYNADGNLQAGMGVAVADFDHNGFLDIAKTNFSGDLTSLYKNEDGEFFSDTSQQAGLSTRQLLGWGAVFLDVDEDGWKDLITANGHVYPEVQGAKVGDEYLQKTLLFRNLGNGRFRDITDAAGSGFAAPRPGRGMAIGDLDGDGRPEIVIVNMNDVPSVLKNNGPRGNWLRLTFEGTKSNRSGIGTRVTLRAGGMKQMDELVGGGSYMSQSEAALYFGLGAAKTVDEMEIRWPNGLIEKRRGVAPNQTLHLVEGGGN